MSGRLRILSTGYSDYIKKIGGAYNMPNGGIPAPPSPSEKQDLGNVNEKKGEKKKMKKGESKIKV